jgi:hypothetical protein
MTHRKIAGSRSQLTTSVCISNGKSKKRISDILSVFAEKWRMRSLPLASQQRQLFRSTPHVDAKFTAQ